MAIFRRLSRVRVQLTGRIGEINQDHLAESLKKSPRILIVRSGAVGDTLMVTPLVRALRWTFPDSYVGFISSKSARDVLRYDPHLNEVLPLTQRHRPFWLSGEKRRMVGHLQNLKLDAVLSLENNPDFTEIACRSGAKRVISYDTSRQGDNVEHVELQPGEHAIEHHLRAGARLGVEQAGSNMELHYPTDLDEVLRERLAEHGIHDGDLAVGVQAGWGSRKHHPTNTRLRSWPADRFAQVVQWLHSRGARVILTGSAAESRLTEFIAQSAKVPVTNMAGQPLLELAALIRRLNLYISVDTGPAHIAAALGTPLITLWGPAIITATAPLPGVGPVRILYSPPPCAPCHGTPLERSCQDNVCMKQITVDEVISAAEEMLTVNKAHKND